MAKFKSRIEPNVIKEPVCWNCGWFGIYPKCSAFPDGIPADIRNGEWHNEVRGDEKTFLGEPIVFVASDKFIPELKRRDAAFRAEMDARMKKAGVE